MFARFRQFDYLRAAALGIFLAGVALMLQRSSLPPSNEVEQIRAFTRDIEFDFLDWTIEALLVKFNQSALGTHAYLSDEDAAQLVRSYIDLISQIQRLESDLDRIFADPDVSDPQAASEEVRSQLLGLNARREDLAPLAESILQSQLKSVLDEIELTPVGQPLPPILYHGTPLPHALIVSPRHVIRRDAHISISPDLTLEEQIALEERVEAGLDVSALVVGIGGIGTYPTMVAQSSNLNWLAEVIAHEWLHNFFNLRPLGLLFSSSPQMRTINETAATIAGKEVGAALIARYYPELAPPEPEPAAEALEQDLPEEPPEPPDEPIFDFNEEMRITRIEADRLLAEGKIEEAEAYMEARRQFLWENGYRIRRLNQAYFAFHGAYADEPGGPAGEDPVGAAVRELRDRSETLADFLQTISWVSSYEELLGLVEAE